MRLAARAGFLSGSGRSTGLFFRTPHVLGQANSVAVLDESGSSRFESASKHIQVARRGAADRPLAQCIGVANGTRKAFMSV